MLYKETTVRSKMRELAKEYGVKASAGGFYAKSGDYFWTIQNVPRSYDSRDVLSGLKPWSWDETLDQIVHPGHQRRYTDLSRWTGSSAMRMYYLPQEVYTFQVEWSGKDILIEPEELERVTRAIFTEQKTKIDALIHLAETQYGGFDAYCIARADDTPALYSGLLYAGFAAAREKKYAQALEFLTRAKAEKTNQFNSFHFIYGRPDRDLRDVLADYCRAMLEGAEWTDANVVRGYPLWEEQKTCRS